MFEIHRKHENRRFSYEKQLRIYHRFDFALVFATVYFSTVNYLGWKYDAIIYVLDHFGVANIPKIIRGARREVKSSICRLRVFEIRKKSKKTRTTANYGQSENRKIRSSVKFVFRNSKSLKIV